MATQLGGNLGGNGARGPFRKNLIADTTIVASGAISGTASIAFGQSASITASGVLLGTTTVIFGQSGALQGQGALQATAGLAFSQSSSLKGSGALAGSSTAVFGQSGALGGASQINGTATVTFGQLGSLDQPQNIVSGGGSYNFLNPRKRKREDEPTKRQPLEIVKIGKAQNEIITGLVIPKVKTLQSRPSALDAINKFKFDAAKITSDRKRQLQLADDEWLMLN